MNSTLSWFLVLGANQQMHTTSPSLLSGVVLYHDVGYTMLFSHISLTQIFIGFSLLCSPNKFDTGTSLVDQEVSYRALELRRRMNVFFIHIIRNHPPGETFVKVITILGEVYLCA